MLPTEQLPIVPKNYGPRFRPIQAVSSQSITSEPYSRDQSTTFNTDRGTAHQHPDQGGSYAAPKSETLLAITDEVEMSDEMADLRLEEMKKIRLQAQSELAGSFQQDTASTTSEPAVTASIPNWSGSPESSARTSPIRYRFVVA